MSRADDALDRYQQRAGWHGDIPEGHYAIPDPHEPDRTTMWRVKGGRLTPWPRKTRQGPRALQKDAPRDLDRRGMWLDDLRCRLSDYRAEVELLIAADPERAAARYAAVTFRCAICNRVLKVPESNGYGVGPECRSWMPDALLARYAERVSLVRTELGVVA